MGMAGGLGHSSHVRSASDSFPTWISFLFYFLYLLLIYLYIVLYYMFAVLIIYCEPPRVPWLRGEEIGRDKSNK